MQTVAQNLQPKEKQELIDSTNEHLKTSLQTKTENSLKSTKNQEQNLPDDLAEFVTVWPYLSEHIKQAIKALVRTVKEK